MAEHTIELLAPAGGPEQLNAALAAGADAIFLGFGHRFNARRVPRALTTIPLLTRATWRIWPVHMSM